MQLPDCKGFVGPTFNELHPRTIALLATFGIGEKSYTAISSKLANLARDKEESLPPTTVMICALCKNRPSEEEQ